MKLTINEIVKAVDGKLIGGRGDVIIQEVSTDSRKQTMHGLFIPLVGERFDGHHFISHVFDKGCVATLTMQDKVADLRLATILVKDTKKALLALSCYYRKLFDLPLVGITGSVGKTSTKEMVSAVLGGKWQVHKTEGNYNNEIGLPLTLLGLNGMHEAAVIEMGMNHFGEIHQLSLTALPDVAVITNIGTSHIENLGSREGILKAKLEILDGLDKKGLLVINGDNDLLGKVKDLPVKHVFYGLSEANDYWAKDIQNEGEYTTAFVTSPKTTYNIRIHALGEHMVYNTLAAIAVAEAYGLSKEEIMKGLESYQPAKMRMHIEKTEAGMTVIDDTYNASPDSMKAALKVLSDYTVSGRRIAVLGDMFEMGEFAPKLHEEVGAFAATMNLDQLVCLGELAKYIHEGYVKAAGKSSIYFATKEAFMDKYLKELQKGDCILFKASRGMHFEELVEAVKENKE